MNLALIGNGKMGRMIEALCAQEDDLRVAGLVGPGDCDALDDIADVDVAVDFSYPGNLAMLLETAVRRRIPLVIGTTGLSDAQGDAIRAAGERIPIVWTNNFSMGVTVLARLTRMAAQALDGFDVEIVETHHNQKEDAPSGTALLLRGCVDPDGELPVAYGREGRVGKRGREIGIHALRGGTVAGEHSVRFYGALEEIELRHRADSREIFARGALKAAAFALKAKPGVYNMEDVLFGGKG